MATLAFLYAGMALGAVSILMLGGLGWPKMECQRLLRLQARNRCRPQMLDLYWHIDIALLEDICATYDRYRATDAVTETCRPIDGSPRPQFRVLGERHSGTNTIATLMYTNFQDVLDPKTVNRSQTHGPYSTPFPNSDMGITEHKHDEQTTYRGPDGDLPLVGLTVVAMRDPYDWIRSMSKNIYGGQQRNKFKMGEGEAYEEAMERFLNTSWVGGDHVFDTSYANIFDMRYRKVCNHIFSAMQYSEYVLYLRQEDDLSDTSKLSVVDAVSRLGWPLSATQDDVDTLRGRYMGHSGSLRDKETSADEQAALVRAVDRHADWEFERILGYLKGVSS